MGFEGKNVIIKSKESFNIPLSILAPEPSIQKYPKSSNRRSSRTVGKL